MLHSFHLLFETHDFYLQLELWQGQNILKISRCCRSNAVLNLELPCWSVLVWRNGYIHFNPHKKMFFIESSSSPHYFWNARGGIWILRSFQHCFHRTFGTWLVPLVALIRPVCSWEETTCVCWGGQREATTAKPSSAPNPCPVPEEPRRKPQLWVRVLMWFMAQQTSIYISERYVNCRVWKQSTVHSRPGTLPQLSFTCSLCSPSPNTQVEFYMAPSQCLFHYFLSSHFLLWALIMNSTEFK